MIAKSFFSKIVIGVCAVWAIGCQSLPVQKLPPGASPSDEISKLQANKVAAYQEQVNVLSPTWYNQAQSALDDAKSSRADGDSPEVTLGHVEKGIAALKKAEEVAKVSRSVLGGVVQARQDALGGGALEHAAEDMQSIDNDLKDAMKKVEKNDTSDAVKERDNLVARYHAVEWKAVREKELGSARKNIVAAESEDASELVPLALKRAKASYKAADEYIGKRTHNSSEVKKLAEIANFDADRLLKFAREAKTIGGRAPEVVLLQKEAAANVLQGEKAKLEDSREDLAKAKLAASKKDETIQDKQDTIESLRGTNTDMVSEQKFNELFNKAQALFNPQEAEVFKQGDTLVVRLKGLKFASGDSQLNSENYSLLGKVKEAIVSFGPSLVTIAGHTDAVGAQASNQRLSEERAKAVEQYLLANGAIPRGNSETVGYGDTKPLATNKSMDGRAQNRRVDISIAPYPRERN